ncbi:MAG: TetR/AcrR family transcriptional regulator [Rhodospirillales bacterium]|nr:TetR/AcrR family transcriptional regulator [Rhodospirillales bacterium]
MAFPPRRSAERDTYHHGNLREALVETVLNLIGKYGPAGFSFADVARAAGVSPAAPYRHFRDRNALLAEVARRGFERFAADLEAAWNHGGPNPMAAMEACGRAYLAFARREPASFAAMFGLGAAPEDEPGLSAAADRAFGVLRRAAEAISATYPGPNRPPALMVALHLWAEAHGIASLFVAPGARLGQLPMSPDELLEAALLIYLQGLALPPGRSGGGA